MSEIQSLVLYLFVFSLSAILIYFGNKKKFPLFTIIGLTLPILLASLRFFVGTDYPSYIVLYDNTDASQEDFNESNGSWTVEPTFWLFSVVSRFLVSDSWLMFGLYSTITVLFFYLAVKALRVKNIGLAMFLYYCFWFGMSLSAVRQFAAISIFIFAVQYIIEGSFKKYVLWMILASTLHVTALLLIPLYFIRRMIKSGSGYVKTNLSRTVIFTVVAMVVSIAVMPSLMGLLVQLPFFEKYEYMMTKSREEVLIGGTFIMQILVLLVSLLLYRGLIGGSYMKALLLALFATGVALYTFGFIVQFAYRFSLYLLPISVLLIAGYTDFISRYLALYGFHSRAVPHMALVTIGIAYFVSVFYFSGRFDIFPYNFIWQEVI